jgi:hypothetical protein
MDVIVQGCHLNKLFVCPANPHDLLHYIWYLERGWDFNLFRSMCSVLGTCWLSCFHSVDCLVVLLLHWLSCVMFLQRYGNDSACSHDWPMVCRHAWINLWLRSIKMLQEGSTQSNPFGQKCVFFAQWEKKNQSVWKFLGYKQRLPAWQHDKW